MQDQNIGELFERMSLLEDRVRALEAQPVASDVAVPLRLSARTEAEAITALAQLQISLGAMVVVELPDEDDRGRWIVRGLLRLPEKETA